MAAEVPLVPKDGSAPEPPKVRAEKRSVTAAAAPLPAHTEETGLSKPRRGRWSTAGMESEQVVLWVAAGVAAIVSTWLLRVLLARAAKVRAHRRRKEEFLSERRRQHSAARIRNQAAVAKAVLPRHAAAIRRAAEQAARRRAQDERPANPFRRGTREFVLWETSYELAATLENDADTVSRSWQPHSMSGT